MLVSKRPNSKRRYSKKVSKVSKVHYYKRFCSLGIVAADSALDQFFPFSFELNNVPGFSELTQLYDFYKINAVKISFIPTQTMSNSLSTISNNQNTRFFSVIDYNDDATVSSLDDLRQYQTCKYTSAFKTHTRYIYKPKHSIASYVQSSQWCSTAVPTTEWYGLKVGIEAMGSTVSTSMNYRVEATYYLSFKNPK